MKLQQGDRIKLTERGALVHAKQYMRRGQPVDWFARRGIVHRVGRLYTYVHWDGRASVDYLPRYLLELAKED